MRRLIFEILEFLRYLNYGIESKNPYQSHNSCRLKQEERGIAWRRYII